MGKQDHRHAHGHAHAWQGFGFAFAVGMALNLALVAGELAFGFLSNSLAVISGMSFDSSSLGRFLVGVPAASPSRTYGYRETYFTKMHGLLSALRLEAQQRRRPG